MLKDPEIKDIIRNALAEDIGKVDITTKLLFSRDKKVEAVILAGEKGIVCGIDVAGLVFKLQDKDIKFIPRVKDGDRAKRGKILAKIYGRASSILAGERVALNFVGFLSGIATHTKQLVDKTRKYGIKIMDTRKTIPGLRKLEKYAVRVGSGYNHRFRLDEMILIKDNHARLMGNGLWAMKEAEIIKEIRKKIPPKMKIEIEVSNLNEFKRALKARPDMIMLDNMSVRQVKNAVRIKNKFKPGVSASGKEGRSKARESQAGWAVPKIEVSGGINLANICAYARTGVDFISLGTLTKDIHCLNSSLVIK